MGPLPRNLKESRMSIAKTYVEAMQHIADEFFAEINPAESRALPCRQYMLMS